MMIWEININKARTNLEDPEDWHAKHTIQLAWKCLKKFFFIQMLTIIINSNAYISYASSQHAEWTQDLCASHFFFVLQQTCT